MNTTARFLIAQYLRDPIRREPKNVGLIVIKDDQCAAQFLGEELGVVDLRSARWANDPRIYQHWVEAWREQIHEGAAGLLGRLSETNGGNYDVILGGGVADTNGDTADTICKRLFPLLVAPEEQIVEERVTIDPQQSDLRKQVTGEFRNLGILARVHDPPPNPVYTSHPFAGKRVTHRPSYIQRGPVPAVMEVINFTTTMRRPALYHAGWAAKMFDDIHGKDHGKTRRVAIIRATTDDLGDKMVKDSLALLEDSIDERVDWNDPTQRAKFLEARREVAYATSA